MIWLYIVFIILLFISFLLLTPINLIIEYKEHLVIKIKLFGVSFSAFSNHQKKRDSPKKRKIQRKHSEKNKNKRDIMISIKKIGLILKSLPRSVHEITKKIKIDTLRLILYIGAEDAAETAIKYGQASALVYPVISAVNNLCTPKEIAVNVIPNFPSEKINADFKIGIKSNIFNLLLLAGILFKKYKEII